MYIVIIKFTNMNDNIYEGIAEGNPVSILVFAIVAVLFIMFYLNGMDMGTHPDTGRPVKSFNTKEGKRAGQRRRYNQKKYPDLPYGWLQNHWLGSTPLQGKMISPRVTSPYYLEKLIHYGK